ncbi:flagellar biosynthetic protein FliO [uncultured Caulobacter sp.]|uniref:flagellar biosynthetic protein FliO n=1 Tax=uncultured Caulobacter sp. TaxID=158749 RepID=UPI00261D87F0|nr:flagellar biosynthetic protein FliO [uncultured Caulobacter sp.]
MDVIEFIRALAALAFTLGLIGLAAWALRKYGPDAIGRAIAARQDRRLKVVESLALDPTRRLVVVSLDGEERLVLLGDGKLLDWIPPAPSPALSPAAAPEPVA